MKKSLILFEGLDHSGKTTQIDKLKVYLEENKHDNIIYTREPGGYGDDLIEEIRRILLDPTKKISPIAEAYLYAASRAQHTNIINKHLDKDMAVICDRHYYSSIAYQGYGRGLGPTNIRNINSLAIRDLEFSLVFYFKLDLDTYLKRRNKEGTLDRMEQESIQFFKKVLNGYDEIFLREEIALMAMDKLVIIDATESIEDIHNKIIAVLKTKELL